MLLLSHSVCSHQILGLFSPLHSWPECSSFFLFSLSCEADCYWIDRGYSTWRQQWHALHDKSVQAFSPLFVLQATKSGHRGMGMSLPTNNLNGCDTYEDMEERVGSKAIPNKPFIYSGWSKSKIADTVRIWPHKSYVKWYQHHRFLTTAHAYT